MRRVKFFILTILTIFAAPNSARAEIALIRDAEIEQLLYDYATPIFRAANLPTNLIKIHIVNDPELNAYVVGGPNMFIHTGLLIKAKSPEMVIGVIAHETGHIEGGHIILRESAYGNITSQTILTAVLGAAVTVAGSPEAGSALILGSQQVGVRQMAAFTREQEVIADQYALRYLSTTKQSASGLLDVMQMLQRDSVLDQGTIDPFLASHPLSSQRISLIRSHLRDEPKYSNSDLAERHKRIVAKLDGYLNEPEWALNKYVGDSAADHYARAVAYHRQGKMQKSITELNWLLALEPNNPFFNELKGQVLAENEKVAEAEASYDKAVKLMPSSALLLFELGNLQLNDGKVMQGLKNIEEVVRIEPDYASAWHLLATYYGKLDMPSKLKFSLAVETKIAGNFDEAIAYAEEAKRLSAENSADWLKAQDLLDELKILQEKSEN